MKLVVGIGNPGPRYKGTRHNLGFRTVERLADRHGIALRRRRFDALVGDGTVGGQRALLVEPQTFVNLSGSAVAPLARWHKCPLDDLMVVCDDLNLGLGALRLRPRGSSGGHNGLASIIECLGTDAFPRLRIGVGRGRGPDPVAHVLGRFERDEEPVVEQAVDGAADAIEVWLQQGMDAAMNAFN
ncbi:MAG: aminoacyl-tRNA hydrolase [Planctomycetota bacterium]